MTQFNKSDKNKGFNLDKLEKKNVFQVPDRYFDELPAIIQSKVVHPSSDKRSSYFSFSLRYALPIAGAFIFALYFGVLKPDTVNNMSYESILTEVSDEDLTAYLENSDITSDELIASIDLESFETDIAEDGYELLESGLEDDEIEDLILEYELEESLN